MKITSSRKDDILKRKAQYEADYAAYQERQKASDKAYREAEDAIINPIREYLERKLSRYSALKFEIDVRRGWEIRGVDIFIRCNERNKFDEDVALAWSYDVTLNKDGTVNRKSSSWSGLSATTEAQMNSLRQTVSALEWLNDVDWADLMDVTMPDYGDYYDRNDKRPERADFERELLEAELEELVGTDTLIKVHNWESSSYKGKYVWLKLLRETPSMYNAIIIGDWVMGGVLKGYEDHKAQLRDALSREWNQIRVRKSSVKPVSPLETYDVKLAYQ